MDFDAKEEKKEKKRQIIKRASIKATVKNGKLEALFETHKMNFDGTQKYSVQCSRMLLRL